MKNMLYSILMKLFIALTITPSTFAQNYIQLGLPEGVKRGSVKVGRVKL